MSQKMYLRIPVPGFPLQNNSSQLMSNIYRSSGGYHDQLVSHKDWSQITYRRASVGSPTFKSTYSLIKYHFEQTTKSNLWIFRVCFQPLAMEAYLLFLELLHMSLFPLCLNIRHLENLILIPSTCKIRLDITSFVSHLWSRLSRSFKLSSWRSAAVVWNPQSVKRKCTYSRQIFLYLWIKRPQ